MSWHKTQVHNLRRRRQQRINMNKKFRYIISERSIRWEYVHILLFFPSFLDFIVIQYKSAYYIYVYTSDYEWFFCFNSEIFILSCIHSECNSIEFYKKTLINMSQVCFMVFKQYLHCFFTVFTRRIKVRGRLFRIFPGRRNILGYRFCHTHMIAIYCFDIFFEFYAKKVHYMLCYNRYYLMETCLDMERWIPLDTYTRRGVKICGRLMSWKTGKIERFI